MVPSFRFRSTTFAPKTAGLQIAVFLASLMTESAAWAFAVVVVEIPWLGTATLLRPAGPNSIFAAVRFIRVVHPSNLYVEAHV